MTFPPSGFDGGSGADALPGNVQKIPFSETDAAATGELPGHMTHPRRSKKSRFSKFNKRSSDVEGAAFDHADANGNVLKMNESMTFIPIFFVSLEGAGVFTASIFSLPPFFTITGIKASVLADRRLTNRTGPALPTFTEISGTS